MIVFISKLMKEWEQLRVLESQLYSTNFKCSIMMIHFHFNPVCCDETGIFLPDNNMLAGIGHSWVTGM